MIPERRFKICFVITVLLISSLLFNQNPAVFAEAGMSGLARESADMTDSGGPGIVFEKTQVDLGKVPSGKDVVTDFVFRNMGSETLVIEKITSG